MITPVPHIGEMPAYALADLTAPAGKPLISLSQNESLRPASPMAVEAATRAVQDQQDYPDPDWNALRAAIGDVHAIAPANIICGNGSLDLINCIARAYLHAGNAALAPAHAYPFFRTATQAADARFDTAAETGLHADVDTLLAVVRPDTRVIFIANPGNPTGTRIARTELTRLREALPKSVLLVIDEAYGEFSDHLIEPCFGLVARGDTVVLRTFSKAYAMAGMRVGWGLFPPDVAVQVRKLLNPNNISTPSQAAATAAMRDQPYMAETCAKTAEIRDRFADKIRSLNLKVPLSYANFILIRFVSAQAAACAETFLRSHGLFLRAQGGAGLPDCLRATVSTEEDMAIAARLLEDWTHGKATP